MCSVQLRGGNEEYAIKTETNAKNLPVSQYQPKLVSMSCCSYDCCLNDHQLSVVVAVDCVGDNQQLGEKRDPSQGLLQVTGCHFQKPQHNQQNHLAV